jgi:hypothetical protein
MFTVENLELHLQKEHLIAESPVFEQMLKSDLTDLGIRQIPLPGRTIYPFGDFLRFRVLIFSQYEKLVTFLYYHLTHNLSQVSEIVENQRKDKSFFQGVVYT